VRLVAVLVTIPVVTNVHPGACPAFLELGIVLHRKHDRLHASFILRVVFLHVHYVEYVWLGRLHVGHLCERKTYYIMVKFSVHRIKLYTGLNLKTDTIKLNQFKLILRALK